jgi:hypothetical protein
MNPRVPKVSVDLIAVPAASAPSVGVAMVAPLARLTGGVVRVRGEKDTLPLCVCVFDAATSA